MPAVSDVGQSVLQHANLPPPLHRACVEALSGSGHLFSASPVWARLFLAWVATLVDPPPEVYLAGAVACEYMAAGYDMIDTCYDREAETLDLTTLTSTLPAALTLLHLATEQLAQLELPAERRTRACAVLARGGRRALGGHLADYALRGATVASLNDLLPVLSRRSGSLVAATCQAAALLCGAPWRTVALAGRFGRALGCAAQLEDDLADRAADARRGRTTIPVWLAALHPDTPELAEATTWVLLRRFLEEARRALLHLPDDPTRYDALWALLPPVARSG